jgi:hypothetical protein
VVFIILSQLNRGILGRIGERSNECRIRRDDLYATDALYQLSDYVYGLQNASFLGIEEYLLLNPKKYPHLDFRFTDPNKNGKVSLYTEDCIFVDVIKDRTAKPGYVDIFTIEFGVFEKPEIIKPKNPSTLFSDSELPIVIKSADGIKPNLQKENLF